MATTLAFILGSVTLIVSVDAINECKNGYNETTNECLNLVCPPQISQGLYPDCTCIHKNFDYSIRFNLCFRVCPDNSNGYWPKCVCEMDGYFFDKSSFKCISCPSDSTGVYPNCSCGVDGRYLKYSNSCEKCVGNSVGVYPHCICSDGNDTYNADSNYCDSPPQDDSSSEELSLDRSTTRPVLESVGATGSDDMECPLDSSGVHPACICDDENGTYKQSVNKCFDCPFRNGGMYPNCSCVYGGTYDENVNDCYQCPSESVGEHPNCICHDDKAYDRDENFCYSCEAGLSKYPKCNCTNGSILSNDYCVNCPSNANGIFPKCKCNEDGHIFTAYLNECYKPCAENMIFGPYPECICEYGYYYDDDEKVCKSNIGRKCPIGSIGIGPDCLCIREEDSFDEESWYCGEQANKEYLPGSSCPGGGDYPQCADSLDPGVLRSLVG